MIWAAAAVAAVGLTTAAVTLAGASEDDRVLSREEVSRQLNDLSGSSAPRTGDPGTRGPGVSAPSTPSPATDGVTRTLSTDAAQLVVRCDGDTAHLEAWSPNPGYRVDDVVRGPAPEVYLEIESDVHNDVMVVVRCEAGEPVMDVHEEFDDHGRNRRGRGHDD